MAFYAVGGFTFVFWRARLKATDVDSAGIASVDGRDSNEVRIRFHLLVGSTCDVGVVRGNFMARHKLTGERWFLARGGCRVNQFSFIFPDQ